MFLGYRKIAILAKDSKMKMKFLRNIGKQRRQKDVQVILRPFLKTLREKFTKIPIFFRKKNVFFAFAQHKFETAF